MDKQCVKQSEKNTTPHKKGVEKMETKIAIAMVGLVVLIGYSIIMLILSNLTKAA